MLTKIKNFFINTYKQIIANILTIFIEIVVIGLGQILLDYGSIRVYTLCVIIGLLHVRVSNFILDKFLK